MSGLILAEQAITPGTPPVDTVILYAKSDGFMYSKDDAGTETQLAVEPYNSATGYIYGLYLSNNSTDATNDIDISTGTCRDISDTSDMTVASTLVKQIDSSWAVGTNQGGMDTGSVANDTWYYIWLIKRSDTGVVDALFSTSSSSPTMPTNYDLKRLIGAVRRETATNRKFYQTNDRWFHYEAYVDVISNGWSTSETNITISSAVPSAASAFIYSGYIFSAGTNNTDSYAHYYLRIATGVNFIFAGYARNLDWGNGGRATDTFSCVVPNTGHFSYIGTQLSTTSRFIYGRINGFLL